MSAGPTQGLHRTLARSSSPLADPSEQRALLALTTSRAALRVDFAAALTEAGHGPLAARSVEVLQVNLGRRCNQTCAHCHVDAGPERTETMSHEVAEHCIELLRQSDIGTLDLTGGAPELSPEFEFLVREATALGRRVIDRCNLTVLEAKPMAGLIDFLADHGVEVIASLPHYRELNTDRQRGEGVFERSISALRRLNERGYGRDPRLRLQLVTNPVGAFLPPDQAVLEREWKVELERRHGVVFDHLFTLTNMPIGRYLEWLERTDNLAGYLARLAGAFQAETLHGLMCRTTLSVGWDGRLYDCDFNQMLALELAPGEPRHIREVLRSEVARRPIVTGAHCFGCTAGRGSSCGGQLT